MLSSDFLKIRLINDLCNVLSRDVNSASGQCLLEYVIATNLARVGVFKFATARDNELVPFLVASLAKSSMGRGTIIV